jgi:hypothetical protein
MLHLKGPGRGALASVGNVRAALLPPVHAPRPRSSRRVNGRCLTVWTNRSEPSRQEVGLEVWVGQALAGHVGGRTVAG